MDVEIICGDARATLATLPSESVRCIITSPPYFGLRDYDVEGQAGLETSPDAYVAGMVATFREARRVLSLDGTFWLVIADSYAGSGKGAWSRLDVQKEVYVPQPGGREARQPKTWEGIKPKDLIGIPWLLAFALRADGWYLRQDIIWHKPNAMPSSVTDRPTSDYEHVFLFAKSARYYYNHEAIQEPSLGLGQTAIRFGGNKYGDHPDHLTKSGNVYTDTGKRNKRSVWSVATKPYKGAHFATFPPALIEPCILAGSALGDTVLDPFMGTGTTLEVARQHGRNGLGIELSEASCALARQRLGIG